MGSGYAGKSTLIKLLTDGTQKLKVNYQPTAGMDCGTITLDSTTKVSLVEMGGQSHFEFMWADKTRQLLHKYKDKFNGARVIAIANKQDVEGSMKPESVQDLLGVPTYGMVAIDPKQRIHGYKLIVNGLKDMLRVAA
jgi:signal recognition particle receptor subunit beta